MKDVIGDYDSDRVKFLVCQDVEDEIEAGTAIVKELCAYASQFHRQPCDASLLTIGLKCGGSDGFQALPPIPWSERFPTASSQPAARRFDGSAGNVRSRNAAHEPGPQPGSL